MIQEHVGSFFIIVEEENPFVLFEEVVPRRGEIVDLPWIVLSQTDYLVLDCPLTSRTISGRIRNGPATRCSFSALGKKLKGINSRSSGQSHANSFSSLENKEMRQNCRFEIDSRYENAQELVQEPQSPGGPRYCKQKNPIHRIRLSCYGKTGFDISVIISMLVDSRF